MKKLKLTKQSPGMHWVGDGFPVRSIFSYDSLGKELDPFLLLDYAAPWEFAPGNTPRGVGVHPHKGFETVTLALQGEVAHGDSHGGGGIIGPGDVQWMTAANGLLHKEFHSEAFTKSGGVFQMAQLWVNLPAKDKGAEPRYQAIAKANIPVVELPDGSGSVRVVAGDFKGTKGAAMTFTPINLWDVTLQAGTSVNLPALDGHTTALVVMEGSVRVADQATGVGGLVLFEREGEGIEVTAESDTRLLYLGGEPIDEPIVGQGPFVMNTQQEILDAFRQFQDGAMGTLE